MVRTHGIKNQAFFFLEGNKASPIPIPPSHKIPHIHTRKTYQTNLKIYNLDKNTNMGLHKKKTD